MRAIPWAFVYVFITLCFLQGFDVQELPVDDIFSSCHSLDPDIWCFGLKGNQTFLKNSSGGCIQMKDCEALVVASYNRTSNETSNGPRIQWEMYGRGFRNKSEVEEVYVYFFMSKFPYEFLSVDNCPNETTILRMASVYVPKSDSTSSIGRYDMESHSVFPLNSNTSDKPFEIQLNATQIEVNAIPWIVTEFMSKSWDPFHVNSSLVDLKKSPPVYAHLILFKSQGNRPSVISSSQGWTQIEGPIFSGSPPVAILSSSDGPSTVTMSLTPWTHFQPMLDQSSIEGTSPSDDWTSSQNDTNYIVVTIPRGKSAMIRIIAMILVFLSMACLGLIIGLMIRFCLKHGYYRI
jgi:hypothetical protein